MDFDRARADQMRVEGRRVLERAKALDGADAAETLAEISSLSPAEAADVAVLREYASRCFAASQASPSRQLPGERELGNWAFSALWEVSTGRRAFHHEPLEEELQLSLARTDVGEPEQVARYQGRRLLEVCSVVSPAPGCARLWSEARDSTLNQVRSLASEGLAGDLEVARPKRSLYDTDEEIEDVLERALLPGDLTSAEHPGPAFQVLVCLAELDERVFGTDGCLPGAITEAAEVIDGGGFAGGARVDLTNLQEAMTSEIVSFAPTVTRVVREELGGAARSDNGRYYLGSAMRISLIWLWSARHAERTV